MALACRHFSEFGSYATELYPLGTYKEAGITQTTKPDQIRGEHLFAHAQQNHVNNEPWGKVFNDLMDRTNSCARAAGKTRFDGFQTYLSSNFILEMRIQFTKEDVFCLVICHLLVVIG